MEKTVDLTQTTFQLYQNGKKWKKLLIVHDLPPQFGLNIQCAFDNWLVRTEEYTEQSLCDYVHSKLPKAVCVPKSVYDKVLKESV